MANKDIYFTEFGKHAFQHITASICGGIYARVYCILQCVYDVVLIKVHVRYLISTSRLAAVAVLTLVCSGGQWGGHTH